MHMLPHKTKHMSEYYPPSHSPEPLSYQERKAEEEAFDQAHTRYQEVIIPSGGEHTIDTANFEFSDNTTVAYIRTSATARGDVDALRIEDVRRVSSGLLDDQKRVHGTAVPGTTDFLLVNDPQAAYGEKHPESGIRGFAAIAKKGEPYEYGRATGAEHDFADMGSGTSRRHFSIQQPEYDKLIVRDLGSTHGLAVQKRIRTAVDGTPVRSAKGYGLDRHDLEEIDRKLGRVDATATSHARKQIARELIAQGTHKGESVDYEPVTRNGHNLLTAREFLADVALRDPDVAKTLAEKHIVGVHGTRSIGLLGIMQSGGMFSAVAMRAAGYPVLAGEHSYQYDTGQKDTSFASLAGVQRTLQSYAASHRQEQRSLSQVQQALRQEVAGLETAAMRLPDPRRQAIHRAMANDRRQVLQGIQEYPEGPYAQMLQHDFPVLIGISREAVERQREKSRANLLEGEEGLHEFRIETDKGLPLEDTPVVAVPRQYVAWVADRMQAFGHENVTVVPIEPFVDPEEAERFKRHLAMHNLA